MSSLSIGAHPGAGGSCSRSCALFSDTSTEYLPTPYVPLHSHLQPQAAATATEELLVGRTFQFARTSIRVLVSDSTSCFFDSAYLSVRHCDGLIFSFRLSDLFSQQKNRILHKYWTPSATSPPSPPSPNYSHRRHRRPSISESLFATATTTLSPYLLERVRQT